MDENSKIYVAGHKGLVGSAIWKRLKSKGYNNLVGRTHGELDLMDISAVREFFKEEQPKKRKNTFTPELSGSIFNYFSI
jgi:GDP-L-fucose synthase